MDCERRIVKDPGFGRYFTHVSVTNCAETISKSCNPDKKRSRSLPDSVNNEANNSKSSDSPKRFRSHSPPTMDNTSLRMRLCRSNDPSHSYMVCEVIRRSGTDADDDSSREPAILPPFICKSSNKIFHVNKAEVLKACMKKNPEEMTKGIARKGISEENGTILARYSIPSDRSFFNPPKLNQEVACAAGKEVLTRDSCLVDEQAKISECLSQTVEIMNKLLNQAPPSFDEDAIVKMLDNIGHVGKSLADKFHDISCVRRNSILASIDASDLVKRVMKRSKIGEFLFGENLTEAIEFSKKFESLICGVHLLI